MLENFKRTMEIIMNSNSARKQFALLDIINFCLFFEAESHNHPASASIVFVL
jgi:hypothetical protein